MIRAILILSAIVNIVLWIFAGTSNALLFAGLAICAMGYVMLKVFNMDASVSDK
ncbi:hypothetical protein [Psychromonas sp. Urea-02u-13]|uniref:hypothetical protein n=1 Tax=Psychromonas sp. Urea-02u-13 TaxID=2058326 RepID=UPI0012FEB3A4|nr:hypothetical protein [Psychromonas sp. Urea-02u-13]